MLIKMDEHASRDEKRLRKRLASIRQHAELQYGHFFNVFFIFRNPEAFKFYNKCELAYRVGMVGFFFCETVTLV